MYKFKQLSHNQVRYLLIPPLALALVHFVSYRKLPFEAEYEFPLPTFASVLFICLVCCESNSFSYHQLSKRWSLLVAPVKTMLKQLSVSILLTSFIFGILVYTLNYIFFQYIPPVSRFLSSLFVALLIVSVETLVFIVRDLKKGNMEPEPDVAVQNTWIFESGQRTLKLESSEIAYIYSHKGLVYIITHAGDKHLTQFSSISELSQQNDASCFFRLNRQFMISAASVSSFEKEVNQKLSVLLNPTVPNIPGRVMVSRYNSAEFKKWIKS